jgi:Family of unknown function (DUF5995)
LSLRRGIVAVAAVLVAVALAGCNGTDPVAVEAPFHPVGSWTGEQWATIEPTLGKTMAVASSNPCQRGTDSCMNAVVGEMTRRIDALGCSHLTPFAVMYRQVSRDVRTAADADQYKIPAYVVHLDSVFATYYFHAIDKWRSGDKSAVPQVWRMAFSAAQGQQVSTLGDMLLGMNAHISRDLAFALANVGLKEPGGTAVPDVVAVNKAIFSSQPQMIAQIKTRYDGSLNLKADVPKNVSLKLVPQIISRWRLEAIQNARDLINARTPADRLEVETQINDVAALRSLLIWKETALKHPVTDNAARNTYCAAHNH